MAITSTTPVSYPPLVLWSLSGGKIKLNEITGESI
jgi:hypothetical protein